MEDVLFGKLLRCSDEATSGFPPSWGPGALDVFAEPEAPWFWDDFERALMPVSAFHPVNCVAIRVPMNVCVAAPIIPTPAKAGLRAPPFGKASIRNLQVGTRVTGFNLLFGATRRGNVHYRRVVNFINKHLPGSAKELCRDTGARNVSYVVSHCMDRGEEETRDSPREVVWKYYAARHTMLFAVPMELLAPLISAPL